jgi:hypothetical protein
MPTTTRSTSSSATGPPARAGAPRPARASAPHRSLRRRGRRRRWGSRMRTEPDVLVARLFMSVRVRAPPPSPRLRRPCPVPCAAVAERRPAPRRRTCAASAPRRPTRCWWRKRGCSRRAGSHRRPLRRRRPAAGPPLVLLRRSHAPCVARQLPAAPWPPEKRVISVSLAIPHPGEVRARHGEQPAGLPAGTGCAAGRRRAGPCARGEARAQRPPSRLTGGRAPPRAR